MLKASRRRHIFKGIHLQDGHTMSDYGVESAAAELAAQGRGQVPVLHLMLPLRGGMYHETSGRHDNESMSAEPLTHTEVSVAVPGLGELQLTVPVDVSGSELLQLVQQRVQTHSAAAAPKQQQSH
uniref:Ubiquitin-like domain-containing protein n=1 Tax=Tetradesmus obliquus TaxID=3088 RepID=A0A383WQG1_TETOB